MDNLTANLGNRHAGKSNTQAESAQTLWSRTARWGMLSDSQRSQAGRAVGGRHRRCNAGDCRANVLVTNRGCDRDQRRLRGKRCVGSCSMMRRRTTLVADRSWLWIRTGRPAVVASSRMRRSGQSARQRVCMYARQSRQRREQQNRGEDAGGRSHGTKCP
jgi:hypothetical protein